MEGGISNLPVLDPGMRATPLSPSEWKQRLQEARNINGTSSVAQSSGSERTILLLDVRNGKCSISRITVPTGMVNVLTF